MCIYIYINISIYIYIYIPTPSHPTEGLRLEFPPDLARSGLQLKFSCFIWCRSYPIFKDPPPELQMLPYRMAPWKPTYRTFEGAELSNFHPSNSLDICWDVARLNVMKQPVEWVQSLKFKDIQRYVQRWKQRENAFVTGLIWVDFRENLQERVVFLHVVYHQIDINKS